MEVKPQPWPGPDKGSKDTNPAQAAHLNGSTAFKPLANATQFSGATS